MTKSYLVPKMLADGWQYDMLYVVRRWVGCRGARHSRVDRLFTLFGGIPTTVFAEESHKTVSLGLLETLVKDEEEFDSVE
jgi:hypothetical protein